MLRLSVGLRHLNSVLMTLFSGSMKQMHLILVSILLEVDFKRADCKLLDSLHLLGIQSVYLPFFSLITSTIIVCNSHLGACACSRQALFILESVQKKISFCNSLQFKPQHFFLGFILHKTNLSRGGILFLHQINFLNF